MGVIWVRQGPMSRRMGPPAVGRKYVETQTQLRGAIASGGRIVWTDFDVATTFRSTCTRERSYFQYISADQTVELEQIRENRGGIQEIRCIDSSTNNQFHKSQNVGCMNYITFYAHISILAYLLCVCNASTNSQHVMVMSRRHWYSSKSQRNGVQQDTTLCPLGSLPA